MSYSEQEQTALVRIISSLSLPIERKHPKECSCCKEEVYNSFLLFPKLVHYFRFPLPSKGDIFTVNARCHSLRNLEKRLHCFLFSQADSRSYSQQEQDILKRIRKIFLHELRNTPRYKYFKKKPSLRLRKKPTLRLTAEEKKEIRNQQKDEARLKFVNFYHYNPLSQKYKTMKEEFFKKQKEKGYYPF